MSRSPWVGSASKRTVWPSSRSLALAEASRPKHWTGVRGSTVSGVSMPISRRRPPGATSTVSQSTTLTTRACGTPSGRTG